MSIELIIPFFNLFRDENLPLWLSLGIISFGLFFFILYYFHVYAPIKRSLRKAWYSLENISGYTQFYKRLSSLDTIFTDSGLKHNWDEFKQTLILPGKFAEEKVIRNTIRPQKYFNFESLTHHYNISLYQALPNIIVGFGLLLTFCGLVSAIYLTGESIISQHSDDVVAHTGHLKNALDSLLKVAAFKFLTSIAGLITSLILTLEIRICNGKLRNEYNTLNTMLERNMLFESQEQLLSRQEDLSLQQLDSFRLYTNRMQKFTEEIARESAQKIALALNAVLKMYIERGAAKIDPILSLFANKIEKSAQAAMTHLVHEFSTMLHEETREEMQALSLSLKHSQEALNQISHTLNNAGQTIDLAINTSAETLQKALATLAGTLDSHAQSTIKTLEASLVKTMTSLTDKIMVASNQMESAGSNLGSILKNSNREMQSSLTSLSNALAQKAQEHSELLTNHFQTASQKLTENLELQTEVLQNSGQALTLKSLESQEKMAATLQNMLQNLQNMGVEQGQILTQATNLACTSLAEALQSSTVHLKEIETAVCQTINTVSTNFKTSLRELEEQRGQNSEAHNELFLQTVQQAAVSFENSTLKASQEIKTVQETLSQSLQLSEETLAKSLRALALEMHKNLVKSSDFFTETLSQCSQNLEQTTVQSSKKLLDLESMICGSISAAADTFKATFKDGQKNLRAFSDPQSSKNGPSSKEELETLEKSLKDLWAEPLAKFQEISNSFKLEPATLKAIANLEKTVEKLDETLSRTQVKLESSLNTLQENLPSSSETKILEGMALKISETLEANNQTLIKSLQNLSSNPNLVVKPLNPNTNQAISFKSPENLDAVPEIKTEALPSKLGSSHALAKPKREPGFHKVLAKPLLKRDRTEKKVLEDQPK
ncbi:MAG: hypothetical protein IJU40_08830 [Desulfovibrionaceae bacterium]|nr:hypothetical protein [Desulfovibrionaceae bacterium]